MIDYILKALLFQVVFLAIYDLALKRETFFQWNRAYLLLTSVLAYVLPLLHFKTVAQAIPQEYVVLLPEVVLSPQRSIENSVSNSELLFSAMEWLYLAGAVLALIVFGFKLRQLIALIVRNKRIKHLYYQLVMLPETNRAFSFFRYVFVGEKLPAKDRVIAHELVHVRQRHTLDLLFFELQKIVFWFNPLSYVYQNRVAELHEYIADARVVPEAGKKAFYRDLLAGAFRVDRLTFVNSYNKKSLIKKRIIMFGKTKSKEVLKLKYLWLIPVLMSMLIYTSCEKNNDDIQNKAVSKNPKREITYNVKSSSKKDAPILSTAVKGNQGYFDFYAFGTPVEGKEISYDDLSEAEKADYDRMVADLTKDRDIRGGIAYKIFELDNGYKVIKEDVDYEFVKKNYTDEIESLPVKPFALIDNPPVYPGCEDAADQKKCFSDKISALIRSEYNTDLAKDLGLQPGKKRVYVQFTISKTGAIKDVKVRGPHQTLEQEALRVIGKLPPMQPGKYNGKAVDVKYTLPITINID